MHPKRTIGLLIDMFDCWSVLPSTAVCLDWFSRCLLDKSFTLGNSWRMPQKSSQSESHSPCSSTTMSFRTCPGPVILIQLISRVALVPGFHFAGAINGPHGKPMVWRSSSIARVKPQGLGFNWVILLMVQKSHSQPSGMDVFQSLVNKGEKLPTSLNWWVVESRYLPGFCTSIPGGWEWDFGDHQL